IYNGDLYGRQRRHAGTVAVRTWRPLRRTVRRPLQRAETVLLEHGHRSTGVPATNAELRRVRLVHDGPVQPDVTGGAAAREGRFRDAGPGAEPGRDAVRGPVVHRR